MLLKRLLILWFKRPKNWKYQWKLELGVYFLKKGTSYQVGQVFKYKSSKDKWQQKIISNLFYNFKLNTITHSFQKHESKRQKSSSKLSE